jgi:hypothetical protein
MYRNRAKEALYKDLVIENIIQRRLQKAQLNEAGGGLEPVPDTSTISKPGSYTNPGYSTDLGKSIGGGIAGITDPSPKNPNYGQQYNRDFQKYWQWIQDYFRRLQQYQQGQGFYR